MLIDWREDISKAAGEQVTLVTIDTDEPNITGKLSASACGGYHVFPKHARTGEQIIIPNIQGVDSDDNGENITIYQLSREGGTKLRDQLNREAKKLVKKDCPWRLALAID